MRRDHDNQVGSDGPPDTLAVAKLGPHALDGWLCALQTTYIHADQIAANRTMPAWAANASSHVSLLFPACHPMLPACNYIISCWALFRY